MNSIISFFSDLFSGAIDWVIQIVNSLLGGIGELVSGFLNSIGLSIEIPATVFDIFNELTIGIGYIFPIGALLPIPIFMVTFYLFRSVFAVFHVIASTVIRRIKVKF